MSSFFTLPASQKKRKRAEVTGLSAPKRSRTASENAQKHTARRVRRDESISGSDSELEARADELPHGMPDTSGSEEEDEDETGAERRLKLAERYLENVKEQVQDQIGFDAEDVDRDLIAERLKENVAETKGKLYRFIASSFDYTRATKSSFRQESHCTTSIATCPPYAYTVSRDLTLTKWELPTPPLPPPSPGKIPKKPPKPIRRRPLKLISTRGRRNPLPKSKYRGHTAPILCVAASQDGKFVATGGEDRKLIIWDAATLKPLRVFFQHRDSVTSLAFRRGTNQLYSASADRTIKTWSLDEFAFVETCFGHQDKVVDVAALSQERCLSAGARDRTVRLWKVVDETQLVFRGGSGEKKKRKDGSREEMPAEGSIDRVAFVDDDTFVTGSDNGSISLWSVHKKKPVFVLPLAHGRDPALRPEDVYAETNMDGREVPAPSEARWISALKALPYCDLIVSGSSDGDLRIWRVTEDRKRIERVAAVGRRGTKDFTILNGDAQEEIGSVHQDFTGDSPCRGIVTDVDVFERGEKGENGLCVVASLGKTHRLGRWKSIPGGQNGAVVFEIPRKALSQSMA